MTSLYIPLPVSPRWVHQRNPDQRSLPCRRRFGRLIATSVDALGHGRDVACQFRLTLHRGIAYLSAPQTTRSIGVFDRGRHPNEDATSDVREARAQDSVPRGSAGGGSPSQDRSAKALSGLP